MLYTHMCVYTYIYIYTYVCMCVCVYIYIYIHMYVYIYIYTHTHMLPPRPGLRQVGPAPGAALVRARHDALRPGHYYNDEYYEDI